MGDVMLTGRYGKVDFIDCRQAVHAHGYDLTFWDPPYNIEFGIKPFCKKGKKYDSRGVILAYSDEMELEDYCIWLRHIINDLIKTSKCVIVHCGYSNEALWFDQVRLPEFTLTHFVINPKSGGLNCHLRNRLPMLGFGKPKQQFNTDIFKDVVKWGFIPHEKFLHPCPMNSQFLMDLIKQSGAQSVYDPMCGSGAIPEACEALGVPWYANEMKKEYQADVEYRIYKGQCMYKQLHNKPITAWYK